MSMLLIGSAFTLIVVHIVLFKTVLVVFVSALCMYKSCHIGKVAQLVGH